MHRLTRNPDLGSHLGHRRPRQHRPNRIQPLLDNRQRNQRQSRPPVTTTSAEHRRPEGHNRDGVSSTCRHTNVKHLPGQDKPSPSTLPSQALLRSRAPFGRASGRPAPLRRYLRPPSSLAPPARILRRHHHEPGNQPSRVSGQHPCEAPYPFATVFGLHFAPQGRSGTRPAWIERSGQRLTRPDSDGRRPQRGGRASRPLEHDHSFNGGSSSRTINAGK